MSVLTENLPRTVLILAVVIVSFGGTLGVRAGVLPNPAAAGSAHSQPIEAGSFTFAPPAAWDRMSSSNLSKGAKSATKGKVVAGLCPPQASATCAPSSSVVYVLLQEEGQFPSLVATRKNLDSTLPRSFHKFQRGEVTVEQTVDRTSFLLYRFSFTTGTQRMHETIAVFRGQKGGAVIVAQGPQKQFTKHQAALREMFASGHETAAH